MCLTVQCAMIACMPGFMKNQRMVIKIVVRYPCNRAQQTAVPVMGACIRIAKYHGIVPGFVFLS